MAAFAAVKPAELGGGDGRLFVDLVGAQTSGALRRLVGHLQVYCATGLRSAYEAALLIAETE